MQYHIVPNMTAIPTLIDWYFITLITYFITLITLIIY